MSLRALHIVLWMCSYCTLQTFAQRFEANEYVARDTLIANHMTAEEYGKALPLIDAQIEYLKATGHTDSLYRYVYSVGRATWRTKDAESGMQRAMQLVDEVQRLDTNRVHLLQAYEDLSWVYFELGRNDLCLASDLRYLDLCMSMPHAAAHLRSIAHYSVGFDYMSMGNWKAAETYFFKSIPPLLEEGVHEPLRMVNSYNALGAARQRMGNFAGAREAFSQSLLHIADLEDEGDKLINVSNVKGNLSLISEQEGDYVTANQLLYEALGARRQWLELDHEPWKKDQQKKLLAANYHNLGALYFKIGDFARAEQVLRIEREYKKSILEEGHPDIDKSYETLGSLQIALEEYDSALVNMTRYKSSCLKHFGKYSYFTATGSQYIGKIHLWQGNYSDALGPYTEAIEIFETISDADTGQELAQCFLNRAVAHANLGNRAAAMADADRALGIYRATSDGLDINLGQASLVKAKLHLLLKEYDLALEAIDQAITNLKKDFENAGQESLGFGPLNLYLPDAYHLKAKVILASSSDVESTKEAFQVLEDAIVILRNNKRAFDGDEAQLVLYEDHAKIFELGVKLAHDFWHTSSDFSQLNSMFKLAEEGRAVLLRRQLSGFSSLKLAEVPDSLLSKERQLKGQLTGRLPLDEDGGDYFDAASEYSELQALIKAEYPSYYKLRYDEYVAGIADVQSELLQNEATLVRYVVSDSLVFAICIGKDHASAFSLPAVHLESRIKNLNSAILSNNNAEFRSNARTLYNELIAPLRSCIKGETLYIIPDKALFALNFETLIDSKTDDYLLKQFIISYLHSATTATQFSKLKPASGGKALAFAPGFSHAEKESYRLSMSDSALIDQSYFLRIQQPFAVQTAQSIASLFAGKAFTGAAATEKQFKDEATKYGIIHLGTHTEVNNLSPLLSRLVLTKTAADDEDGYLHAYEIYNLSLRAELAVLTACETGIGKTVGSEGVMSLAHSFAYAGIPSIVMSLWQIDEKTSAEIVEGFYREIARGVPKNEALRNAKLAYLASHDGDLSAPYYWSGLVLIGDVAPISSTPASPFWWAALVGVVVLLLSFWVYTRRRRTV